MKKLIAFAVALFFFGGFAFAQHTDIVSQTGDDNVAQVEQKFVGGGGALDGNEAYVTQVGSRNKSDVYQDNNGFAGSKELATVYSEGNDNIANVTQINDGFVATVTQLGHRNDGRVFQSGNKGMGTVYQDGNDNLGRMNVWGTNSDALISQVGDDNDARQNMGQGVGLKVEDSYFEAIQVGNRNTARQDIVGQGFAGGITSDNNNGWIYQEGNDNFGRQDIGTYLGNVLNNTGYITQYGNNNDGRQFMNGDGNTSTIFQDGNDNQAVSLQN
jgi:hypothetical protein